MLYYCNTHAQDRTRNLTGLNLTKPNLLFLMVRNLLLFNYVIVGKGKILMM